MVRGTDCRPASRLRRPAEFAAVMGSRLRVRGECFEVRFRRYEGSEARLGLVIPKRLARRAVLRNLLKRLAREAFRQALPGLPCADLVVRLCKPLPRGAPSGSPERKAWRMEMDRLFAQVPA